MIISIKLAIRCLYNFFGTHTTICMVFLLKSQAKERSAFNKYRSYVYHGSAGDNEGITRSGAGRKGWPRVMIRGWQKRSRSAQRIVLVNHRLTHCLGGAVSRWVQSLCVCIDFLD